MDVSTQRATRTQNDRENLLHLHAERAKAIQSRLAEFLSVKPSEYFYELAYCLLTPQSSAVNADAVVAKLRASDFLHTGSHPEPLLRDPRHYIRFHRVKSRRLLKARDGLGEFLEILAGSDDASALRDLFVDRVDGFGLKEATHFLRNIGRNGGLTILDRHILRNLKRYGAIRTIPKTISRKKYLAIEQRFVEFSAEIGIPVDELDLLFWSMETGEIRK